MSFLLPSRHTILFNSKLMSYFSTMPLLTASSRRNRRSTMTSTRTSDSPSKGSNKQALWNDSRSLVHDMERLALVTDKSTSRFSSKFDIFSSNCRPLFNSAPSLHTHPAIKDRVQTLRKAINEFTEAVNSAAATFTSSTTTSVTSPSYDHRPRMAPINLDIPKINGDPLQWGSFQLSLQSWLKHRAEGFSDMD